MKRLFLIPLLIAISGCSNNLSYTSRVGEKILIKKEAVEITDRLTRKDFEKQLVNRLSRDKNNQERKVEKEKRSVNRMVKKMERSKSSYGENYYFIERDKKELKDSENSYKAQKDFYVAWLKRNERAIRKIVEELPDTPQVHAIKLDYTMIITDLLGEKRIEPRDRNRYCFNPKLSKNFQEIWEDKLNAYKAFDIICEKFAKF